MSSQGRSVRVSRSVVSIAVALLLVQCDRDRTTAPTPPEAVPSVDIAVRPLTPPPPLSRAELIAGLAQSASVFAAGSTLAGPDPLVGRSFSLRLPFGCGGTAIAGEASDGLAQWTWGEGQSSMRLSMTPGDWITSPLVAGAVVATGSKPPDNAWEAVEGFWIARPWLANETCPTAALSRSISAPPSPQTVGIVAVFPEDGSRLGRRDGQAYQHTIRAEDDTPLTPPVGGFALRLEGRVVGFPDGRASRCVAYSPDQRPTCVAAVQLDRVAFEAARTGSTLSEWRVN